MLLLSSVAACGRIGFDEIASVVRLQPDRAPIEEDVPDLPVLVVLDDDRGRRGTNVRFVDAAGGALPYEIEQTGTPGGDPLIAWVRLSLQRDEAPVFYAVFGESSEPEPDPTSVWSADYAAVWHLADDGAVIRDSTAAHHDGVPLGTRRVVGTIGSGRDFQATLQEAIVIDDRADLSFQEITYSAWVNERTRLDDFATVMARQLGTRGSNDFHLADRMGLVYANAASPTAQQFQLDGEAMQSNTWIHLAVAIDDSTLSLYRDGVFETSRLRNSPLVHSPRPIILGADRNDLQGTTPIGVPDTDWLDGVLDEARIERRARSAARIALDVASMRDALISYSPVSRVGD